MSETTSTISLDAELENNFAHIAKTANTSESEQVHKLMRDHIDKKQTHPSFMPPENCTDESTLSRFANKLKTDYIRRMREI